MADANHSLENLLQNQTELLRDVLDGIADGVAVANEKGEFISFNAAAARILGMGPEGTSQEEWAKTYGLFLADKVTPFPTDDLPLAKAIRGESSKDVEMYLHRAGLSEGAWLCVSARPFVSADGNARGGVAIFRDITRQKTAEEAWELLETATHQASDCILITSASMDEEPRIVFVNSATVDFLGHPRNELLGQTLSLLQGARTDQLVSQLWWKFAAEKPFHDRIYVYDKDEREYFADLRISPLMNEHGVLTNFVCVLRDITDQKETEEAVRSMNHDLEHRIQDLENMAVDIHTKLHVAAMELLRVSQGVEERLARGSL